MKLGTPRPMPGTALVKKPRKKKPPVAARARDSADGKHKAGLATIPAALEEACKTFEAEVGGRGALVAHLAHGDLKARDDLLVGAIADPRNDVHSLARICMLYGLKFADLLQLFRGAGFVRAQLAAMQRIWKKLPDVAGDVMDRSVPHDIVCSTCAGEKVVTKRKFKGEEEFETWEETCEDCAGRGTLVRQPHLDTQKVALQLGGLLDRGSGVQVNVSQQQGLAASMDSGFSDFFRRSDKVLYPDMEEAVDAEVVEAETDEA